MLEIITTIIIIRDSGITKTNLRLKLMIETV